MKLRKEELEEELGFEVTDQDFCEVVKLVGRKREHIISRGGRKEELEHWYFEALACDCARSMMMQRATTDLCGLLQDMEKERRSKERGTPQANHILSVSAQ